MPTPLPDLDLRSIHLWISDRLRLPRILKAIRDVAEARLSALEAAPGGQGPPGTPGGNAFTTTTASYAQPAVSSNVTVTVANTAWMVVGQSIFIGGNGGSYTVSSITNGTTVVLTYNGGGSSGTVGASGSGVSPSGVAGVAGETHYSVPAVSVSATNTVAVGQLLRVNTTSAPAAATLPASSPANAGSTLIVYNTGTGSHNLTVSRAGSDTIGGLGSGVGVTTSLPIPDMTAVEFVDNGDGTWTAH